MAERTQSVSTMESGSPAGEDTSLGCGACGEVTFGGYCDCDHDDPGQEEVEEEAAEAADRLGAAGQPGGDRPDAGRRGGGRDGDRRAGRAARADHQGGAGAGAGRGAG